MGQLDGRVALITGGARGQGAVEAKLFISEDARVVIADVRHDEGLAVAAELGEAVTYLPLDVTKSAEWNSAIAAVMDKHGRLDVLVNNAGLYRPKLIEESTEEDFLAMFSVNQFGVYLGMKAALPAMRQSAPGKSGGSIINISSVAGFRGAPGSCAYAGTKFAVRGMTKVAALEFAPWGIRVNSVHPGIIDTDMISVMGDARHDAIVAATPLQRAGTSDDVAKLVLFLASDASSFCTGSEFVVDGGLNTGTAVGPRRID